jgi:hypothetical protein
MNENRLEKYTDRADKYFTNDKPRLIVIDESHNLRNDKSNRYKFLLNKIIKANQDIKILMISATPINNSLIDIRNQFKLITKDNSHGFEKSLGIRNLDYSFRTAQMVFNDWRQEIHPNISNFIKKLPPNFFTLTDSLIVARTRKMIEEQNAELTFPQKTKPINLFVTPRQLGNFESFEELFDHFPPMLSGYQPAFYLEETDKDILHDERQRDRFLVKMMYILMVKRLESSWYSFYSTVEKIKNHHQNALDKIKSYQNNKTNDEIDYENNTLFADDELEDEFEDEFEELTLGKKRIIKLSEIDKAGNLDNFKTDLKKDLEALDNIFFNLQKFSYKIEQETKQPRNLKSSDDKLETLITQIQKKKSSGENNGNPKVIVFTVYHDTAFYLFDQLKRRGFDKLAMVSGSGSRTADSDEETKNFEPILERFAPYTKLFMEKEWDFHSQRKGADAYNEWIEWVRPEHPRTFEKIRNPIDILIATDTLSEGQNLQDADMVINYDVHWNPVRIVQRMGRIDRLGSPNRKIFGINFWPSNNINTYLNLQGRIEQRMAAMKLAGAEVDERFSDSFNEMIQDESLDQRMRNRMMQQMETTLDDLETEETFGFDDLSLEKFRQDLLEEFKKDKDKYLKMPKGVYTGFKADADVCADNGLVALLGYPANPPKTINHQYKSFDLIYINEKGKPVLMNQKEVLDALTHHKDHPRFVPDEIDRGEETAIQKLVAALKSWLKDQAIEEVQQEDGTTKKRMGAEAKDLLSKLRTGDKKAIERVKENLTTEEKYKTDNFDLITWFLITL